MRMILAAVAIAALATAPVSAAQCRDAKGKFIKCAPTTAAKPTRCRTASGKLTKCGTPGRTQSAAGARCGYLPAATYPVMMSPAFSLPLCP